MRGWGSYVAGGGSVRNRGREIEFLYIRGFFSTGRGFSFEFYVLSFELGGAFLAEAAIRII